MVRHLGRVGLHRHGHRGRGGGGRGALGQAAHLAVRAHAGLRLINWRRRQFRPHPGHQFVMHSRGAGDLPIAPGAPLGVLEKHLHSGALVLAGPQQPAVRVGAAGGQQRRALVPVPHHGRHLAPPLRPVRRDGVVSVGEPVPIAAGVAEQAHGRQLAAVPQHLAVQLHHLGLCAADAEL